MGLKALALSWGVLSLLLWSQPSWARRGCASCGQSNAWVQYSPPVQSYIPTQPPAGEAWVPLGSDLVYRVGNTIYHRFTDGTWRPMKWDEQGKLVPAVEKWPPQWQRNYNPALASQTYQPGTVTNEERKAYKPVGNGLMAKDGHLFYDYNGRIIPLVFDAQNRIVAKPGYGGPAPDDINNRAINYYNQLAKKDPTVWEGVKARIPEGVRPVIVERMQKANPVEVAEAPQTKLPTTPEPNHDNTTSPITDTRPSDPAKPLTPYEKLRAQFDKAKPTELETLGSEAADGSFARALECHSIAAKEDKIIKATFGLVKGGVAGSGVPVNGLTAGLFFEGELGYDTTNSAQLRNHVLGITGALADPPSGKVTGQGQNLAFSRTETNRHYQVSLDGDTLLICGTGVDAPTDVCCSGKQKLEKKADADAGKELERRKGEQEGFDPSGEILAAMANTPERVYDCQSASNPERHFDKKFQVKAAGSNFTIASSDAPADQPFRASESAFHLLTGGDHTFAASGERSGFKEKIVPLPHGGGGPTLVWTVSTPPTNAEETFRCFPK